jgi:hypothetical protein
MTLGQTIWRPAVGADCEFISWLLLGAAISLKRPSLSSAKGLKKPDGRT